MSKEKLAYEFLKNSGYPSVEEGENMLESGNVVLMPAITGEDVRRACEIYGNSAEYVRGKLTKLKVGRAKIDYSTKMSVEKVQELHSDVMHLEGSVFLVSTTDSLNLLMQNKIENEKTTHLGLALQEQLNLLRSRDFQPRVVHTDPHSSFRALVEQFPGVEIDFGGSGDHVPKIDIKILWLKEVRHCVLPGLPSLDGNVCLRVLFTSVSECQGVIIEFWGLCGDLSRGIK